LRENEKWKQNENKTEKARRSYGYAPRVVRLL
jgi:hypothetical protein